MSHQPRPLRPWTIAFFLALAVAAVGTTLVAAYYRHLGMQDVGRFLAFSGLSITAILASVGGICGWLATRIVSPPRRAVSIAVGIGVAALLFLFVQAFLILDSARIPLWGLKALACFAVVLAAAPVAGVSAYLLARSGLGHRRGGLAGTVICAILAGGLFATRQSDYPEPPPVTWEPAAKTESPLSHENTNVLLITIDTLRADHLKGYGYSRDTAPILDRLGRRGILFEQAITQRTVTAPSLATLLTGTYPPTHKVFNNGQVLQDHSLTLAEIFANRGYHTTAVISNPGLTAIFNFNQGFEQYQRTTTLNEVLKEELQESRQLNKLILPTIEQIKDRRFFMWVHYRDPHTPYLVPEPYKDLFTSDGLAGMHEGRIIPLEGRFRDGMPTNAVVHGSRNLDFLVAQYDAEIRFNDESLGALLDKLEECNLSANTLVIVTADHGESLWEHDRYFTHAVDRPLEPVAHVPLIFYHPKLPSGLRVSTPVSLVEVAPTILELLRLPPSPTFQAGSFAPLVLGQDAEAPHRYHFIMAASRYGYQTHALRTDTHKLLFDVDQRWVAIDVLVALAAGIWLPEHRFQIYRCRRIVPELYDLTSDPGEQHNTFGQHSELEEELSTALWRWLEASYYQGRNRDIVQGQLTEELERSLKALGYLR